MFILHASIFHYKSIIYMQIICCSIFIPPFGKKSSNDYSNIITVYVTHCIYNVYNVLLYNLYATCKHIHTSVPSTHQYTVYIVQFAI